MLLFLGILAVSIAIVSYSLYLKDVFVGYTKPHGFSWLIWAILNTLIFYQQIASGAGPGAWVTAVAAGANMLIFLVSLKYGERNITRFDWICLGLALIAVMFWLASPHPVLSVMLASSVFIIGLIPTFRKSLISAHEETAITFALNALKFLVAIFALESLTLTTLLYPLVLVIANGFFAVFLFTRQASVRRKNSSHLQHV